MDLPALRAEIIRLARALAVDMPLRQAFQDKSELGCLLLQAQEFLLDTEYLTLLASCGLSLQAAKECIAFMFRRHAYRWTI